MELHCYDGPPGPDPKPAPKPEKRKVMVSTIQELRVIVERIIQTGRLDIELHFDHRLMAEDEFYEIMGLITEKHPKVDRTPPQEVVSYSVENFGMQQHRGRAFKVEPFEDGYRVLQFTPCGSAIPTFDITFQSPDEAAAHAKSEIDMGLDA